jgi:hypothetical protein
MICHEAKPMGAAIEFFHNRLQKEIQPVAVALVEKYRKSGVTAKNYMVDCTGIMYARFTRHERMVLKNSKKSSLTPKGSPKGSLLNLFEIGDGNHVVRFAAIKIVVDLGLVGPQAVSTVHRRDEIIETNKKAAPEDAAFMVLFLLGFKFPRSGLVQRLGR